MQNFETLKLVTSEPYNPVILALLVLTIAVSCRKQTTRFLDRAQTDQLKGLSILLLVIGHLGYYVVTPRAVLTFGSEGVALFLMLSGFGLTRSSFHAPPSLSQFVAKRVSRVFLPYWLATALILSLDFLLLDRTYSATALLQTALGINVVETTKHIDYARWFITLLLFWYASFFVLSKLQSSAVRIGVMLTLAGLALLMDYYVAHFGWNQIFAFPAGCYLGSRYERLERQAERAPAGAMLCAAGLGLGAVVLYKTHGAQALTGHVPSIVLHGLSEGSGLVFSLSVILLISALGKWSLASGVLAFTGPAAYELFLLHGPFLLKYNFILSGERLIMTFLLYLIMLVAACVFLHRGLKFLMAR